MMNYKRLCEISGQSSKKMRLLIESSHLANGLIERKYSKNCYGKGFYNYWYSIKNEDEILKILGFKNINRLKRGFC